MNLAQNSFESLWERATAVDLGDPAVVLKLAGVPAPENEHEARRMAGEVLCLAALARLGPVTVFASGARKNAPAAERAAVLAKAAARFLPDADGASCARHIRWMSRVLLVAPESWARHAGRLLEAWPLSPDDAGVPTPPLVLRAVLEVLGADTESCIRGLKVLHDVLACAQPQAVLAAILHAARKTTRSTALRTMADIAAACAGNPARSVRRALLFDSIVADEPLDSLVRDLAAAGMRGAECRLAEVIWHIKAGEGEKAHRLAIDAGADSPCGEWFELILGLCALDRGHADEAVVASASRAAKRRELSLRWMLLQAAMEARAGGAGAVDALCRWLEHGAGRLEQCRASLPLAGIVAYVGHHGAAHQRRRMFTTLSAWPSWRLSGDAELPALLAAVAGKNDSDEIARDLLRAQPPLLAVMWDEWRARERGKIARHLKQGETRQALARIRALNDEDCEPLAEELASIVAAERVLRSLAPDSSFIADPQRFAVLSALARNDADDERTPLRRRDLFSRLAALNDREMFKVARALALLHWEWASEAEDRADASRACHEVAHALWRQLLPCAAFWEDFAKAHATDRDQVPPLQRGVLDAILGHHAARSRHCLQAGEHDGARFHLRCLESWSEGARPPPEMRPLHAVRADAAMEKLVRDQARALVQSWVDDVLKQADAILRNVDPKKKDDGIKLNYWRAIAVAEPLLEIMPAERGILAFVIRAYRDYGTELFHASERHTTEKLKTKQKDEARKRIRRCCELAHTFAEAHLRPGDGLNPDNQLVCEAFERGWLMCNGLNAHEEKRFLERFLKWGGLAEDADVHLLLLTVREHVEAFRLEQAAALLRSPEAPDVTSAKPGIRDSLCLVHHKISTAMIERSDFAKALVHARIALSIMPDIPNLKSNVEQLEQLIMP